MTFDNGVDGAVKPLLTHSSRDVLLIQEVGYESGAFPVLPKPQDFLDYAVLFRVHNEFAIKPVVAVGEDRRPHLLRPRCFLLRTFDRPPKCVATGRERLADGGFGETRFCFYLA